MSSLVGRLRTNADTCIEREKETHDTHTHMLGIRRRMRSSSSRMDFTLCTRLRILCVEEFSGNEEEKEEEKQEETETHEKKEASTNIHTHIQTRQPKTHSLSYIHFSSNASNSQSTRSMVMVL